MPDKMEQLRERVTVILRDGVYDVSSLKRVADSIMQAVEEDRQEQSTRYTHMQLKLEQAEAEAARRYGGKP